MAIEFSVDSDVIERAVIIRPPCRWANEKAIAGAKLEPGAAPTDNVIDAHVGAAGIGITDRS